MTKINDGLVGEIQVCISSTKDDHDHDLDIDNSDFISLHSISSDTPKQDCKGKRKQDANDAHVSPLIMGKKKKKS